MEAGPPKFFGRMFRECKDEKGEKNIMEQKQEDTTIFMKFLLAITTFIGSKEYIPTARPVK